MILVADPITIAKIISGVSFFIKKYWKVLLPLFILLLLSPYLIYICVTSILLPRVDQGGMDLYVEVSEANEIDLSVLLAYDTIRLLNNMAEADPYKSVFDFLIIDYYIYEVEEVTKNKSDVNINENIVREFTIIEDGVEIKMAVEKIYNLVESGSNTGYEQISSMLNKKEFLYSMGQEDMTIPKVVEHIEELGKKDQYFFDYYILSGEEIISNFNKGQILWFNGLSKMIARMFSDEYLIDTETYIVNIPEGMEEDYFPSEWPLQGDITGVFGELRGMGRVHKGLDISANTGTEVSVAASGKVIYAGWQSGYGWTVMVHHGSGITTLYGHLDKISVKIGQDISKGDRVGLSGNSGDSEGPHLHFEVRENGVARDPLSYLR